ncbi:MAG: hypothetical protein D3921_13900 [Candidatus Electrothrix sp. AW1]|nr:hypothetical protein [Candidatus Electrothrix sp. AX1]MCI5183587.1 hypothetical protein [Candidatus Electrothrix gigas]
MLYRKKTAHKYQRTGSWTKSKRTNCTTFDPYVHSAEHAYFEKYYDELNASNEIVIKYEKTHEKFLMPVSTNDIETAINSLPSDFFTGLKGVILLSGSNKQFKGSRGNLFCFGIYYAHCIFLFPYPKDQLVVSSQSLPAPHIRREYERAGAVYSRKDTRWVRSFNKKSLKTYYLKDVFVHELGHHVDRHKERSEEKSEIYADWFATEHGFKRARG